MHKCFCCNHSENYTLNELELKIHILNEKLPVYIDNGNRTSEKYEKIELCNECYNKVGSSIMNIINQIKNK